MRHDYQLLDLDTAQVTNYPTFQLAVDAAIILDCYQIWWGNVLQFSESGGSSKQLTLPF
jgi:hypothetical protein